MYWHDHAPLLCLEESATGDFALTLAVERGAAALERPVALSAVLGEARWAKARYGILQQVSVLAEFFPPLAEHVRSGAAAPLVLAPAELPGFLFDTLPVVRLLGMRALLPKALDRLLRPRLSMQVKGSVGGAPSFLKAGDIFAFDWKVAIGDRLVSRAEFERLVKKATGIVRFKGEYVYLDPAQIERLRAQLDKPPRLDAAELMRVALAGEYGGAAVRLDARAQRIVQQLVEAGEVPAPAGLQATLRPYHWCNRTPDLSVWKDTGIPPRRAGTRPARASHPRRLQVVHLRRQAEPGDHSQNHRRRTSLEHR
ncbi:SNF2 helicase-associated domain-containing protein [Ramlibacter sp. 2FC]|uniref:SNF2 helicase-associated domain-containing protein n=1 Tax=Ramlibacter sp. 2FC TaxID=2502188 RepID=UPI0010F68856|nr:SNF2 helicase-associated domain-containing protein [Ramlibacter sp. 2FC]